MPKKPPKTANKFDLKKSRFTKKGQSLFKKKGMVLSFDPGTVNCGQALICSKKGIAKPRVHKFIKKKNDSLSKIISRIYQKFSKDTQIQACIRKAKKTNGLVPEVVIENQEGVSSGFKLAVRMIRMGTVAGAIAMFFWSHGFKNVHLVSKSQKWVKHKPTGNKSKALKKAYKESALHVIRETDSGIVESWLKDNKKKAQHVYDAIVQGMYMLT